MSYYSSHNILLCIVIDTSSPNNNAIPTHEAGKLKNMYEQKKLQ
jgi:hypothetical protein